VLRIRHLSILATSLVTLAWLAPVAAGADVPAGARLALDEPPQLLALVGPALAIGILTIVGLTITFRGLRHDIRKRRSVYRSRRN
jgi:hypothetical protein